MMTFQWLEELPQEYKASIFEGELRLFFKTLIGLGLSHESELCLLSKTGLQPIDALYKANTSLVNFWPVVALAPACKQWA